MQTLKRIRSYSEDEALISERRKNIVNVASKLFLKRGFQRTTTRELTEALGMSKGALYHYIGSKQDILYLVLKFSMEDQQRLISEMRERTKGMEAMDAIKESINMYIHNVDELQDMYNFNNHAAVDLSSDDRHILFDSETSMVGYFERLVKDSTKQSQSLKIDPRIIAHDIVVAANAWANRRWYLRKHYTLDEYIEHFTSYTLRGMAIVQAL